MWHDWGEFTAPSVFYLRILTFKKSVEVIFHINFGNAKYESIRSVSIDPGCRETTQMLNSCSSSANLCVKYIMANLASPYSLPIFNLPLGSISPGLFKLLGSTLPKIAANDATFTIRPCPLFIRRSKNVKAKKLL